MEIIEDIFIKKIQIKCNINENRIFNAIVIIVAII